MYIDRYVGLCMLMNEDKQGAHVVMYNYTINQTIHLINQRGI